MTRTLWTIGHSTRSLEDIAALLRVYGIERLVDVRRFPRGKRQPHLSRDSLARALPALGIEYVWLGGALGGFRAGGYEQHTSTPEFASGIAALEALAGERPAAVMCAELMWSRCHRRFIARAMAARGWAGRHIVDASRVYEERTLEEGSQGSLV